MDGTDGIGGAEGNDGANESRQSSSVCSAKPDDGDHHSSMSQRSNVSRIINDVPMEDELIGEDEVGEEVDWLVEPEESGNDSLLLIKERQKTFERITRSMERNTAKWKRLQEQVLLEEANVDDSYSRLIDGRINEIKSMCWSVVRPEYILDSLTEETRAYALSLVPVSRQDFEATYRRLWTKLDLFRFGVRMTMRFCNMARAHMRYPWWEDRKEALDLKDASHGSNMKKFSINNVLRQSLTSNPRYRSDTAIQQVLWFNRAIGAFSDLFSNEMENELARYISYEIYDQDRVIRLQGDVPHKLYYILAGKIEMVRVYRLSEGEVHKSMGFLTHKQMSDFESFEMRSPSPTYLVARGRLEVLSLHREDYATLSNQTNLDSIRDFIHQIGIFKDIVIVPSTLESQHLKIKYFKNDKIITSNPQKEPYIYVIKSGHAVVVRKQTVLRDNISSLLNSVDVYSIGCKRDGKHASAMLGLPMRQKTIKEVQMEKSKSMDIRRGEATKIKIKPQTMITKFVVEGEDVPDLTEPLVRCRTLFDTRSTSVDPMTVEERQRVSEIQSGVKGKSKQERETYVKLDTLHPLDIFGLDSIEGSGSSKERLLLISEGAEVVMINKRYFLGGVDNNTRLEIRKMTKSYLSEEEAKSVIDDDTKWKAYKKVLMEKMISLRC